MKFDLVYDAHCWSISFRCRDTGLFDLSKRYLFFRRFWRSLIIHHSNGAKYVISQWSKIALGYHIKLCNRYWMIWPGHCLPSFQKNVIFIIIALLRFYWEKAACSLRKCECEFSNTVVVGLCDIAISRYHCDIKNISQVRYRYAISIQYSNIDIAISRNAMYRNAISRNTIYRNALARNAI